MIIWCDRHDRHLLVDERDGAVLHLACRIAFGVDVRDFLQLQRAFERDRVVDPPAEVQEIGAVVEALGHLFHRGRRLDGLLEDLRHLQQLVDVMANLRRRQRAAHLRHVEREQLQRDELRRERLGRGHANLWAGVRVDRPFGFTRGHAADHVADGDSVRALPPCFTQRGERLRGLP